MKVFEVRNGEPGPRARAGKDSMQEPQRWRVCVQRHRSHDLRGIGSGSGDRAATPGAREKLWWEGTDSKQEMEGEAGHVSMEDGLFYQGGGLQMGRGRVMRLQRMEGQDGVTRGMRVESWTGPKGSRDLSGLLLQRTHLLLRMPCAVTGPQREGQSGLSVSSEEPHT